jgi:hypothetical protein
MIGLVPLSAIGLYNIMKLITKHEYSSKINKIIAIIISIILFLLIFINSFYGYYDLNYQLTINSKASVELYHCYTQSNQTLQYQLSHSRCFPEIDYSALEPLLHKRILFPG